MVIIETAHRIVRAPSAPTAVGELPARRFARRSSAVLLALMAIESALGLFVHGLYREERWAVAALRGNDLVTLVLVVPALALALALTQARRSERWVLVWLAALLYGVYNFAYYVFGTAFNDVFLLHVASFALSIPSLVAFASSVAPEALARQVRSGSHRAVAVFLVLVGGALISAWGGLSLRFAVNGRLPADVMPPSAIHLVYALDLSLLAPAFLAGGILLWRERPWGRVLATAVSLFGAAYLVVLEVVGGFEADAGVAGKTWLSFPSIAGAVACAVAAGALLRKDR